MLSSGESLQTGKSEVVLLVASWDSSAFVASVGWQGYLNGS